MHTESHDATTRSLVDRAITVVFNTESYDATTRRMVFAMCQRARDMLSTSVLSPDMHHLALLDSSAFEHAVCAVANVDGHMFRYMLPEQIVWHCLETAAKARFLVQSNLVS